MASSCCRAAPELDGVPYYPLLLDFGPASVDGWLSRLVAAELQIEEDSILDLVQHQLVLDGRRVDLTKLEFGVISYLHERQGTVVGRSELLRDVWGYDDDGGSNVIEANVRSLRRKLGERASSIETVRGIGFGFALPDRQFGASAAGTRDGGPSTRVSSWVVAEEWSGRRGSNPRHPAWEADTLPAELLPLGFTLILSVCLAVGQLHDVA